MPGTLTVKTTRTITQEVRQEITLEMKPKGAPPPAAKGNPHDVGAQAFFMKGGAKTSAASVPAKAAEAMRALEVTPVALADVSPAIPRVA